MPRTKAYAVCDCWQVHRSHNARIIPTTSNMFYSTLFIAVTALSGFVSAQNYSTSGNLTIDPNSVELTLRQAWCRAEQNNCPLICGGRDSSNNCDPVSIISTL